MADKQEQPSTEQQFWDKYIRDNITNSISRVEESGAKIQTAVAWIWTAYTTGAVVGTSIFKPSFPWYINLLIALPIFLIMLAYVFSVRVQLPILNYLDQNLPESVKMKHTEVVTGKHRQKNIALSFLFAAAVSVFLGILLAVMCQPGKATGIQTSQVIQDGNTLVAFTGHFPPNKQIQIKIASLEDPDNPVIKKLVTDTTSSNGDLHLDILVGEALNDYEVVAEWQGDDGLVYSLTKVIESK